MQLPSPGLAPNVLSFFRPRLTSTYLVAMPDDAPDGNIGFRDPTLTPLMTGARIVPQLFGLPDFPTAACHGRQVR